MAFVSYVVAFVFIEGFGRKWNVYWTKVGLWFTPVNLPQSYISILIFGIDVSPLFYPQLPDQKQEQLPESGNVITVPSKKQYREKAGF